MSKLIGIIPSSSKTFEVRGTFESKDLAENKLYVQSSSGRLYFYSTTETRSNPTTGFFPIWDGEKTYVTKFSNEKYLDKDVTKTDIKSMCSHISGEVAEKVQYLQRRSENDEILEPPINDGDNMFTQCVKGILNVKKFTLVDLVDMSEPKIPEKVISNYYSALTKIAFMRLEKWLLWMDKILHMNYITTVYKGDRKLLSYEYPNNEFETGIVKYDNITKTKDDQFKKIIKILMIMENINKNSLRSEEVDDYTINNLLTTLNSKKSLSSQLFSRFIRMADLSYEVHIFEENELIFEYRESGGEL